MTTARSATGDGAASESAPTTAATVTRPVLSPKCDPVGPVNVTVALRLATGPTGVGLADGVGHGGAVETGVGVGVSVDVGVAVGVGVGVGVGLGVAVRLGVLSLI